MSACVLPVSLWKAEAWLLGVKTDSDLILNSGPAQAVFVVNLPDLVSYRDMLEKCRFWRDQGAKILITRTSNPVVLRHLKKNGAVEVSREDPFVFEREGRVYCGQKRRCLIPADGFSKWVDRWS